MNTSNKTLKCNNNSSPHTHDKTSPNPISPSVFRQVDMIETWFTAGKLDKRRSFFISFFVDLTLHERMLAVVL